MSPAWCIDTDGTVGASIAHLLPHTRFNRLFPLLLRSCSVSTPVAAQHCPPGSCEDGLVYNSRRRTLVEFSWTRGSAYYPLTEYMAYYLFSTHAFVIYVHEYMTDLISSSPRRRNFPLFNPGRKDRVFCSVAYRCLSFRSFSRVDGLASIGVPALPCGGLCCRLWF